MTRFVLDASVALAWFIDRPTPPYASRVREVLANGGRAFVPWLWHLEVANGFLIAEKRGMLLQSDSAEAIEKLELLLISSIDTVRDLMALRKALHSARRARLTTYDACYLDLADDMGLPLATLDHQLAEAAKQTGVPLLH